jgi:hypothetical protein
LVYERSCRWYTTRQGWMHACSNWFQGSDLDKQFSRDDTTFPNHCSDPTCIGSSAVSASNSLRVQNAPWEIILSVLHSLAATASNAHTELTGSLTISKSTRPNKNE